MECSRLYFIISEILGGEKLTENVQKQRKMRARGKAIGKTLTEKK